MLFLKNLNFWVTEYFPVENLGIAAGLIISIILTISFWLMDTTRNSSWDRIVTFKKIINLQHLLFGFTFLVIPFLFWAIPYLQIVLLIIFAFGIIFLGEIFFKSILWITDWTDSSSNGIRHRWRKEVLLDPLNDPELQLTLWQIYLDSITNGENKYQLFNKEQFFDFFKHIYKKNQNQTSTDLKVELIEISEKYMENIFNNSTSNESEFLKFAFKEFFNPINNSDNQRISFIWSKFINKEVHNIVNDEDRSFLFVKSIEDVVPSTTNNNKQAFTAVGKHLFNLLWLDDIGYNSMIRSNLWEINSNDLLSDNSPRSLIKSAILNSFFKKVQMSPNEISVKLNSLAKTIFPFANLINLNYLYKLFYEVNIHNDLNKVEWYYYLYTILSSENKFGFATTNFSYFDEEVAKKKTKLASFESIKLAITFFPAFKNKKSVVRYIDKIVKTLNSKEFISFIEKEEHKVDSIKIAWYSDILSDVKKQLTSLE